MAGQPIVTKVLANAIDKSIDRERDWKHPNMLVAEKFSRENVRGNWEKKAISR